jgi:hypothetical protein
MSSLSSRSVSFAAALALSAATFLHGGTLAAADRTIGVYFDAEGTQCHGTIHPGTLGTIYVLAKLDPGAPGINGAEFRFVGVPESWQVSTIVNPNVLSFGDPFGIGVGLAFFGCQRPASGVVLIFKALVVALAEESDITFSIENRDPPSNPGFRCPLIIECDEPNFSKLCVEGVPCTVNASRPGPCPVTTAATETSWSAMKEIYRD